MGQKQKAEGWQSWPRQTLTAARSGLLALQAGQGLLTRWLPLICLLITLLLVPIAVMQRELWTDEAYTASYMQHSSIAELLNDVRKNEETPPVYFVSLWLWSRLAGQSELALRVFSLLCGLLAVAIFVRLAQRWLAPDAALIASLMFALSPVLARYLVEMRGYALLLLLALLCIAAFERLYQAPTEIGRLALYALLAALLFLTTYFGAALIAAHNLIWAVMLLRRPAGWQRRLIGWCAAQLLIGLLILPWAPSLLYQIKVGPAVSPFLHAQPIHYLLVLLMLPMHVTPKALWSGLWLLLALGSWVLIFAGLWHARDSQRALLLRTFVVPAAALAGLILWTQAIGPRYLMTLLPGMALALGLGAAALWRRRPKLVSMAVSVGLAALIVYRISGVSLPGGRNHWRELVPQLAAEVNPSTDVVLFHPPYEQRTFTHYYHGPPLRLVGANDYDDFYYGQGYNLFTSWTQPEALKALPRSQRIWLVYNNPLNSVPLLDLPYNEIRRWKSGSLEIVLYEGPDAP